MSSTSDAGSYRAVLALPYAAPTFGAALVGRLSYGLLPLSVLFTVQPTAGSFATAGGVVAVLGLTSILLPLKSRLVDRHGQASVLALLALLCAGALAAMTFLAWSDSAPVAAYFALGIVAGLGAPPLGPAMRSTWRTITDKSSLKQRAYSLDSVREESLYLIGIAICAAVTSLTALGTLMAVMGLAIAPLFVVSYLAADELAPEHQQTEASTWVNTANNPGSAAGASVAGLLIDRASTSVGFAVGAVILGLTSVLIWLTHRSIEAKSCTRETV